MGLDIYFHKTRWQSAEEICSNYKECIEDEKTRCIGEMAKEYASCIKKLSNASPEEYDKVHKECVQSMFKHFSYPEFDLNELGYQKKFCKYSEPKDGIYGYYRDEYKSVPVEKWIDALSKIIGGYYAPEIAYFRKVNFLFAYFQNHGNLIDQYFAPMSKEQCLDIIDRCDRVLKDHSLAEELLPTQEGFFFGDTNYDDWYFKDVEYVKKELETKCLPVYDEPCYKEEDCPTQYQNEKMSCYVIFSW